MTRKISVVTGSRSEYGLLKPILKKINESYLLDLALLVTGMHLSQTHGYTIDEIKQDGFIITTSIDMLLAHDSPMAMAKAIGIGILGITQALEQIRPDLLLVLGDRGEAFAAATAAAYIGVPVAHVHGGEETVGAIDNSIRHCITKLSHVHFPSTNQAASRIIKMGEEAWRVHLVGAPGLDTLLNMDFPSREVLFDQYGLDPNRKLILSVYHPETIGQHAHDQKMKILMSALDAVGEQILLIYPNSDAGYADIIKTIQEYEHHFNFRIFSNVPHVDYLSLLKESAVMVGNSSSGIIEAPSFKVPVINIGERQSGRERANNVIDVMCDKEILIQAINKALSDEIFIQQVKQCTNLYGDGQASARITEILETIEINDRLLKKQWHDGN